MALVQRSIVWVDSGGRTRQTLPTADPSVGDIMDALVAHSQAAVLRWFEGEVTEPGTTPAGGTFAPVSDIVTLLFATSGTSVIQLGLPSPSADIFEADTVTVDPSAIADIITAAVGTLQNPAGDVATSYIAGIRNLRSTGTG